MVILAVAQDPSFNSLLFRRRFWVASSFYLLQECPNHQVTQQAEKDWHHLPFPLAATTW